MPPLGEELRLCIAGPCKCPVEPPPCGEASGSSVGPAPISTELPHEGHKPADSETSFPQIEHLIKLLPEYITVRQTLLSFAKTLLGCEINNIAAAAPPALCNNSWPYFDSSACFSDRWFAFFERDKACSSRILLYANSLPR
jgi:hypothetical protein